MIVHKTTSPRSSSKETNGTSSYYDGAGKRSSKKNFCAKSFFFILILISSVSLVVMNLDRLNIKKLTGGGPDSYDTVAEDVERTELSSPHHRTRNFIMHPLTSEEARRLSERDSFGFSAAICHPTIHGKLNSIGRFLAFVSYYRLLGFDHVFVWYEKESISTSPSVWEEFNILANLSYVTMTEFVDGGRNAKYYGQALVQADCFLKSDFGACFDWLLVADANEFLWFDQNVTIKEF